MTSQDGDEKKIVYDAVRGYLTEAAPREIESFDLAFDAMYDAIEPPMHAGEDAPERPETNGVGLTGEQFADMTAVTAALWAAKSLLCLAIDPILDQRVLPALDGAEAKLAKALGLPELIHKLRVALEIAIRKHLGRPPSDKQ